jgi:hypothetical protein
VLAVVPNFVGQPFPIGAADGNVQYIFRSEGAAREGLGVEDVAGLSPAFEVILEIEVRQLGEG